MHYYKGEPSRFIIKYRGGNIKRKGIGLGFFYLKKLVNIVAIPITTTDANFIFNELTANFQDITLQGHITYKINDPLKISTILDFSITPMNGQYLTEDPEKLELRIKNIVQRIVKKEIMGMKLKDSLFVAEELATKVMDQANDTQILQEMGIDVLSCTFTSIKPTPEISKALEAEYREALQRKADEAIYARRAAAVEQESKIKENQLQTQIVLEEKKKKLIELNGQNILSEAEFTAQAEAKTIENYEKFETDKLLAYAIKELANNANKIGDLTITSEILAELLKKNK